MVARARSVRVATVLVTALVASGVVVTPDGTGSAALAPEAAERRARPEPRCTVVGTRRADRLVGTPGRDVICGGGGNDVLVGRGGRDVLDGGGGGDRIDGGAGADQILGGAGGDEIDGGPGVDVIDGGAGANVCATDAADEAQRCVYDKAPAQLVAVSGGARTIDVTVQDQEVVFRVHASDDTGVASVVVRPGTATPWFPSGWGTRTAGTARNGWYEVRIPFPKWGMPGTYRPEVVLWDRLGRSTVTTIESRSFTVVNRDPDTVLPEVTLLSPALGEVFDTQERGQTVTVRVRITDARTGVDPEQVSAAVSSPDGSWGTGGGAATQVSGTARDGVYTLALWLPRRSLTGEWTLTVSAGDVAGRGSNRRAHYYSAAEYQRRADYPPDRYGGETRMFAGGGGTVQVLGRTRTDTFAPTVSQASVAPALVDTLAGPVSVAVTVDASDVGSGIDGMAAYLESAPAGAFVLQTNPGLASGTVSNGRWRGTIQLPQGLPPGVYHLRLVVWDHESNSLMTVGAGLSELYPTTVLAGSTSVTVVDSAG